ncbi:MAG: class I SAM-dependent methyltransferase [Acidimicrobiales bacterium]
MSLASTVGARGRNEALRLARAIQLELAGRGRLSPEAADELIEQAYQCLLARPPDESGRSTYRQCLLDGRMDAADLFGELASSEEFEARVAPPSGAGQEARAHPNQNGQLPDQEAGLVPIDDPSFVDVRELMRRTSVEELARSAEEYFRAALPDPDHLLAKPLAQAGEAAELLVTFGHLLAGLRPLPDMDVLDFGVGTCWTTRALAQLGCRVTALDVSTSALELGRELFRRSPLIGDRPEPSFLLFDGHHIEMPDESVDRICCFDAFHHVPNPAEVMVELGRVLRPGGIAGFSEPAHNHSRSHQSQLEMRSFGVVENDIVMADIVEWSAKAGLEGVRLGVFATDPCLVDLPTFEDLLKGGLAGDHHLSHVRQSMANRRMFFLRKPGDDVTDSRDPAGLAAELVLEGLEVRRQGPSRLVSGMCRARNTGLSRWLPCDARLGPVSLGARLSVPGRNQQEDFARIHPPGNTAVEPGQTVEIPLYLAILDATHPGRSAWSWTWWPTGCRGSLRVARRPWWSRYRAEASAHRALSGSSGAPQGGRVHGVARRGRLRGTPQHPSASRGC